MAFRQVQRVNHRKIRFKRSTTTQAHCPVRVLSCNMLLGILQQSIANSTSHIDRRFDCGGPHMWQSRRDLERRKSEIWHDLIADEYIFAPEDTEIASRRTCWLAKCDLFLPMSSIYSRWTIQPYCHRESLTMYKQSGPPYALVRPFCYSSFIVIQKNKIWILKCTR